MRVAEKDSLLQFLTQKERPDAEQLAWVQARFDKAIAPVFQPIARDIYDLKHMEYWLKGGRGSTKSSAMSLIIVKGLMQDSRANAIIYRKVAATLRESVYAQIAWAIEMLGLTDEFIFHASPLEIIREKTGQKIMFRGADDPGKSKSIKLARGYFRFLWFEEVTEFGSEEELRTIRVSVMRGRGRGQTIATYNPPISAQNWTNAAALMEVPGRLVHHSTYLDVPKDWLGEAFWQEAEALKASNERAYRHTYLGEITGTGGAVFTNLQLGAFDSSGFDRFQNGLDFGFAVDPDAFMHCHYDKRERVLYICAEVYGAKMSAETLCSRAKKICKHEIITCDSADPRMISMLAGMGLRTRPAKKGQGSVEHGIRWLQELAAIRIDPKVCPNAAREFSAYEYKRDRYGNFMAAYPDEDNHAIDAVRYAVEDFSANRVVKILKKSRFGL
jgi:phage terminase large subunit